MLLRHGKSDWDAAYSGDHQRPLADRGVRSAKIMGRLITAMGMAPDQLVCSTALRAAATAEIAMRAGGWDTEVEFEDGFYGTGPDTVLELASLSEGDRLMLVGHQPTWSMLVQRLTGAAAEMKTASLAVIEIPIDDWAVLPEAGGLLSLLIHPRGLFGSEWDYD